MRNLMLQPKNALELVDNFNSKKVVPRYTLKGLLEARLGMLIAAPNMGKSHLALSIAIEHSSSYQLVNLSNTPVPAKTLILSTEDDYSILGERLSKKMDSLPPTTRAEVAAHLDFIADLDPLVILPDSTPTEKAYHQQYLDELVERMSNYDLVIVDTVTEAIGACEETKHDRHIKEVFSQLAKRSGASILLVHHINKDEIRGKQKITMASGAGLTTIMRLSKFIISIENDEKSSAHKLLKFHKFNHLSECDHQTKKLGLDGSLTVEIDPKQKMKRSIKETQTDTIVHHSSQPAQTASSTQFPQSFRPVPQSVLKEPKQIQVTSGDFDEEDLSGVL